MSTIRGSTRRSLLIKISAGLGVGLITAGLAAAGTVPVHDRTTDHAAATRSATADEPTLREGSRNATPSELAAKEMPPGPEIAVDRLFGPAANAATQVVPL